jgi:predicted NodU family carbamoyl transferase
LVSRQLIKGLVAAIAIGGAVINSHVAWSNTAEPVGNRAYVTPAEFDQAFAAAAAASRTGNTPANRERLRNVGWKHLNGPIASK